MADLGGQSRIDAGMCSSTDGRPNTLDIDPVDACIDHRLFRIAPSEVFRKLAATRPVVTRLLSQVSSTSYPSLTPSH